MTNPKTTPETLATLVNQAGFAARLAIRNATGPRERKVAIRFEDAIKEIASALRSTVPQAGVRRRHMQMRPESTPELIEQARLLVLEKPSTSYVQRKLMICYNHACELIEYFEDIGVISKPNSAGKRSVLALSAPAERLTGEAVEVVAKALQEFWQGPSGRSWQECCEKLPPQADWFRRLAQIALASSAAPALTAGTIEQFVNELGNTIRITIEGPTSKSTNDLTPLETEKLSGVLNKHFDGRALTAGTEREALQRLVSKLEEIHEHPRFKAVWECAHFRLGAYDGPTYTQELIDAKTALSAAPAASGADKQERKA